MEDKWIQAGHGLGVSESDEKILVDLPGEYSLATKGTNLVNVCGPGRKAQSQSVPTWYMQNLLTNFHNTFTFQEGPSEDKKKNKTVSTPTSCLWQPLT